MKSRMTVLLDHENIITYEGRLLGALDERDFASIIKNPSRAKRLATVGTKSIKDIIDLCEKIEHKGLRIAMAASKKNGKILADPAIIISEPIDYLSEVVRGHNEMSFISENNKACVTLKTI